MSTPSPPPISHHSLPRPSQKDTKPPPTQTQTDPNPDDIDLDTSDINSLASETLHETRPNRWRGAPSTWTTWTARERRAHTALENTRRQDLATHLYNAFGLRRGFRPRVGPQLRRDGQGYYDEHDDEEGGKEEGWRFSKVWTAWPVRAGEVPEDDGVMPVVRDVNEGFTLRRAEGGRRFAGCNLEEEISAMVLRRAREKFGRRGLDGQGEGQGQGAPVGDEEVVPSIEKGGDVDGVDEEGVKKKPVGRPPKRKRRLSSPSFTPVVSADDELSYALLRPAARRIMAQLDDTLMILHNSRVAGLGHMSESSGSDGDETDAEAVRKVDAEAVLKTQESPRTPTRRYRGGRPKKVQVPLGGETEEEMLVRLARAGKKRMPTFSADNSGPDGDESGTRSRSRSRSRSRGRRLVSEGLGTSSRASSRASSHASSRSRGSNVSTNREKTLARWGLRNWRDVIGAAAMAGFSQAVIARATQRCSTLFREEMVLHTLHEQPATSDKVGVETVRYVPGGALLSSSDGDDDGTDDELFQLRTISRQSSVKLAATSSPEPEPETPRRSRSGTPGAVHLCSFPNCPRAIEGFPKRTNLVRHLKTMHGKDAAEMTDDEQDSMDEMEGGVHVDRFLQPIKVRKGWRAEDKKSRPPRARKKARAGSEELDGGGQFL